MVIFPSLHITLCFLGAIAVSEVDPIIAALGDVRGAGEASLTPAGALWLPRRRPGVLAVRLDDEGARLGLVQARVSAALADGGWYVPEQRPYLHESDQAFARFSSAKFQFSSLSMTAFT